MSSTSYAKTSKTSNYSWIAATTQMHCYFLLFLAISWRLAAETILISLTGWLTDWKIDRPVMEPRLINPQLTLIEGQRSVAFHGMATYLIPSDWP